MRVATHLWSTARVVAVHDRRGVQPSLSHSAGVVFGQRLESSIEVLPVATA